MLDRTSRALSIGNKFALICLIYLIYLLYTAATTVDDKHANSVPDPMVEVSTPECELKREALEERLEQEELAEK